MSTSKSGKAALVVIVLEAVVCVGLVFFAVKTYRQLSQKDAQLQQLTAQAKEYQDKAEASAAETQSLRRNMVSKDDYNRALSGILMLKNTAASAGLLPETIPAMRPEQLCELIRPLLGGGGAAASDAPAGEMTFHRSVVEKEIATWSVIDARDTEKNAVCLYHLQKVLDASGYALGGPVKTTADAVMKFQADSGLKADGKIGAKTWAKILERIAAR